MDFGSTARTPPIGAPTLSQRIDTSATRDDVAVELPPRQTVQSADAGDAVRIDLSADAEKEKPPSKTDDPDAASPPQRSETQKAQRDQRDTFETRTRIEPRTRTLVFEKKDTTTGETVQLVPDEVTLKLRLYTQQLEDRARAASEAASPAIERSA